MTLAVDFLTIAVLTQNKVVAKARDRKSPECEIQTGLNCGYDGLSEVIFKSFTHSSVTNGQTLSEIICTSINSVQWFIQIKSCAIVNITKVKKKYFWK